MLCSILFLSLGFDVLTDHFNRCPSCRQKAETLAPECFFPKFFPDFRILFFQQPAAGTFISIDKFAEFCFRLCTKHYMHMVNIMIPFLQNNSIPWILSPNKCSFLFFAIHLPPVEEGEFLLYIMLNIPIPAMIVNRCLLYVFVRVELRFPLYLPSTAVLGTAFAIFPICRLPLRYTCDHISFFSHL